MAKVNRNKRVLFFVNGPLPTDEQRTEAEAFGPGVVFRNAALIRPDDRPEAFDDVAGEVPEIYAVAKAEKKPVKDVPKPKAEPKSPDNSQAAAKPPVAAPMAKPAASWKPNA